MAEPFAHHFERHALFRQERCMRVAQAVSGDPRDLRPSRQLDHTVPEAPRVYEGTVGSGKDEIVVLVSGPEDALFFLLR